MLSELKKRFYKRKYERLVYSNKDIFAGNEVYRNQWIKETLSQIEIGKSILDAGAGECQYKKYCQHLKYVSQDFCAYTGEGNGEGGQEGNWDISHIDIVCDIVNMPIDDNSFDVVMCTEVFEHVIDPARAMRELVRVLKPGGLLILSAPFVSYTHFAPYHFCTGFNKYWYREVLKSFNCRIEYEETNGNYFDFVSAEIVRIPHIYSRYLKKELNIKKQIELLKISISLKKYARETNESNEFLCFGYHVKAIKAR